jgi:ribose transport system permease protein
VTALAQQPLTDAPVTGTVRRSTLSRILHVQEAGVIAVLAVVVLVVAVPHHRFVGVQSLTNLGRQSAFFGIIALGMVFLLAMREIDISVGGNYAVCTVVTAVIIRDGLNPWIAAVLGVALGVLLGAINGVLANLFRLPIIIVSLGTLTAYLGTALVVTNSSPIGGQPTNNTFYTWLGRTYLKVPAVCWLFVVLCVVLTVVFRSTRFGFAIRAVGSNEEAARLTGYAINRLRLTVTMMVGALCGLSGVFTLAYFGAADPGVGTGYELSVIAAAIIGGTGLAGGSGSVPGALLGALIISSIAGGLTQFGVPANWGNLVTGAVIVIAVGFDAIVRRRALAGARS